MSERSRIYVSKRSGVYKKVSFAQWQKEANKYSGTGKAGWDTYFCDFFPLSLSIFKEVLKRQRDGVWLHKRLLEMKEKYDVLISVVGFSPEPLMHTICSMNPKKVFPVMTREAMIEYTNTLDRKNYKNYFSEWLCYGGCENIEICDAIEVSTYEPIDTFSKVRGIIKTIRNKRGEDGGGSKNDLSIAIDVTGGKKSAVSAAYLVTVLEGDIDIFYVDFEEYDARKPPCGTEFLNKLDNPYDIYNIQLLNHAKALFENHRYDVAYDVFSQIETKMNPTGKDGEALYGLEDEWQVVKKMRQASSCYMNWDKYLYDDAENTDMCLDEKQKDQLSILRCYKEIEDKKAAYLSDMLYNFIIDRFLSAQRRWHENRSVKGQKKATIHGGYHDAMLRYFQCVEVMVDAYITRNIKDSDYHPDDEMYRLSMKQKLKLCFNGLFRKKHNSKDNKDGSEGDEMLFELTKTMQEKGLKGEISILIKHRDVFVHVRPKNQQKDVSLIETVVKELMGEVFYKENQEINQDLESLRFKRSFDEKGNMI